MEIELNDMPATAAEPRPASTVALLRAGPEGLETFLLKRSRKVGFMPGAHVFPGGRVDPEDSETPASGGERDRLRMESPLGLAHQIAAVRETFEESGVLLAEGTLAEGDRARLDTRELGFAELARRRGWRVNLERMVYWSWWITPPIEPRRYDTRFFVAEVGPGVQALHDGQETVAGSWWRPVDALAAAERGEMRLAPPTWVTLSELSSLSSPGEALEAGRARATPAIIPRGGRGPQGELVILLPGDPLHPSSDPVPGPTRFVFSEARWVIHR